MNSIPKPAHQVSNEPASNEQERGSGRTTCRYFDDPCSICGATSPHTEYFCVYNYMEGRFSSRACREQCSPGRHTMAADSLGRFVRVTNVPSSMSERELRWLFQRFGPLRMCGGDGFGLVTFGNRDDAEEAVDELNGCESTWHTRGRRRLRIQ
ncbi:hypothetical protein HU200_000725 [Digitaria exilis]|uniref:RRM domain-containing protein n=1 Tax=Digitaria exilis TaxID=1010633 RepID=A0A835G0L9_9POAL|nr:hypothetical protein HU200_000725 [Digitaria exilis]